MKKKQICQRCILDSKMPGVKIDPTSGLCQFCKEQKTQLSANQNSLKSQFDISLKNIKGKGKYDAIFALSGGKDSCYTLYQLKNLYQDLRILAIQFDNGFISETAFKNARHFCDLTQSDYCVLRPDRDALFDIFNKAASSIDVYSTAVKFRTSDICNTCINIIKQKLIEQALIQKVPFLIFGFTPGQTSNPIIKLSKFFFEWSRNQFESQLKKMGVDDNQEIFLLRKNILQKESENAELMIMHPLCVWGYNKKFVHKKCIEIGWIAPNLLDPNSTNCLLNTLAIDNHIRKYGLHPYAYDLAELVRNYNLNREDGINIINSKLSKQLIKDAKKILKIKK